MWEFWMELKKIKSKAFVEQQYWNNLTLYVYFFFEAIFLKLNEKRLALICFIEITSVLAHVKARFNQAVKPYSFNVVKRRGFYFFYYENFQLAHALLNAFSQMISIISMNVNKTKLPATKGFTIVHCRLWNMVHGSNLNWNRCIHTEKYSPKSYVVNFHTQISFSQSEGRAMVFTRQKNNTSNKNQ